MQHPVCISNDFLFTTSTIKNQTNHIISFQFCTKPAMLCFHTSSRRLNTKSRAACRIAHLEEWDARWLPCWVCHPPCWPGAGRPFAVWEPFRWSPSTRRPRWFRSPKTLRHRSGWRRTSFAVTTQKNVSHRWDNKATLRMERVIILYLCLLRSVVREDAENVVSVVIGHILLFKLSLSLFLLVSLHLVKRKVNCYY